LLNALGAATLRTATAALPVPPSEETTALVVFVFVPAELAVTLTEKAQEAFGASVAFARLIVLLPAVAVITPASQLPVRPLGVETATPAGSGSVNPIPVSGKAFELVIVKARMLEPPIGTVPGVKLFPIVAALGASTVSVAGAPGPAPPSIEVI
jgi:hypothetical protein